VAVTEDIAKIIDQERQLVLAEFNESIAFELGMIVRERAVAERMPIVCDIRTWDRRLFYFAMPGSTSDNPDWARRKSNTVQRLLRSSYRAVLQSGITDEMFPAYRNLPVADFALSGGSFPITVRGAGVIGAMTVSGLPQRDDHSLVVAALCEHLRLDAAALALAKPAAA
jgi:uncharacterized protein (UPF0303 family)